MSTNMSNDQASHSRTITLNLLHDTILSSRYHKVKSLDWIYTLCTLYHANRIINSTCPKYKISDARIFQTSSILGKHRQHEGFDLSDLFAENVRRGRERLKTFQREITSGQKTRVRRCCGAHARVVRSEFIGSHRDRLHAIPRGIARRMQKKFHSRNEVKIVLGHLRFLYKW